ncbi:MAG: tetratricopeptide repeat protein [Deltaproteobacteria bacterium]|nr:tetratricopeptide repeat protein [Deltaproteobacteria bacterium]
MNAIWTDIWNYALQPYFVFGKRWIFLIPIVVIFLWFLTIKIYKKMTKKDTVVIWIYLIPSIVTAFIFVILFFVLTNLPLHQPKDGFTVAIAEFKPISDGAKEESKNLQHRLIEVLRKSQKKLRINLKVLPLTDSILDTTNHKYDIADTLGRHYRAHIVIFGVVRVDNKEVFFEPIIYSRVKSKYLKPESIKMGEMLITPSSSDMERINFKERKVEEISYFVTFILGLSQFEADDFEKAIRIFKTVQHQGFESFYFSGLSFLSLNKFKEALRSFNSAIELNPDLADAWSLKGSALYRLRRFEDALEAFSRAIELNPDNANTWSLKGFALYRLKNFEDALEAFSRAVELNPDLANAWSNKGAVLSKFKRYEDALKACDRAIELNPDLAGAWSSKGAALYGLNRLEDALEAFSRAIELNPDLADAWANKGSLLNEFKRYEDALEAFSRAIELNPDNANTWSNKGFALYRLKNFEDALEAFSRAVELNPDLANAWSNKGAVLNKFKSDLVK